MAGSFSQKVKFGLRSLLTKDKTGAVLESADSTATGADMEPHPIKMAPLLELPAETLLAILDWLPRNDLLSLMKCSQGLLQICQPLIYREIRLKHAPFPERILPLVVYNAPDRLISAIRKITVVEYTDQEWKELLLDENKSPEACGDCPGLSYFMDRVKDDQIFEFIWDSLFQPPNIDLPFLYSRQSNLTKLCLTVSNNTGLGKHHSEYLYNFPNLRDLRVQEIFRIWDIFILSRLLESSDKITNLILTFRINILQALSDPYVSDDQKILFADAIGGLQGLHNIVDHLIYSKIYAYPSLKHLSITGETLPPTFGHFVAQDRLESLSLTFCNNFQTLQAVSSKIRLRKVSFDGWDSPETVVGFVEKLSIGLEEAHFLMEHHNGSENSEAMARIVTSLQQHSTIKRISIMEQNAEGEYQQFNLRFETSTSAALGDLIQKGQIEEAMHPFPTGEGFYVDVKATKIINQNFNPPFNPTILSKLRVLYLIPSDVNLRERLVLYGNQCWNGMDHDEKSIVNAVSKILNEITAKCENEPPLEYLIFGIQGQGARTFKITWVLTQGFGRCRYTPSLRSVNIGREYAEHGSEFHCYEFACSYGAKYRFETELYELQL